MSLHNETHVGGLDDDLLTRYLVGEVTADERARVEGGMPDPALLEHLKALEESLILSYLKGELPVALRTPFAERIMANPSRRRHVDDMRKTVAALEDAKGGAAGRRRVARWFAGSRGTLLAAAIVGVAVASTLVWRGSTGDRAGAADGIAEPVAVFELRPGVSRSGLQQANVFRRVRGGTVRLRFSDPAEPLADMRATLRPVGAPPLAVPRPGTVRAAGGGIEVEWLVPPELLAPGDYLVIVAGRRPDGERETVATRFFSVVD